MRFAPALFAFALAAPAASAATVYCGDVSPAVATAPASVCFNQPYAPLPGYGFIVLTGADGIDHEYGIIDGSETGTWGERTATIDYAFKAPFETGSARVEVTYTYIDGTYPGDGGFEPAYLVVSLDDASFSVPKLHWMAGR